MRDMARYSTVSMTDNMRTCEVFLKNTKRKRRRQNSEHPKRCFKRKPTGDLYYRYLYNIMFLLFCMYNT